MSVVELVKGLGSFFKIQDKARIDNLVFQAHYRATTSLFFLSSILITAFSLLGDPIKCMTNPEFNKEVLNNYCWVAHTYSWKYHNENTNIYPGAGIAGDNDPRFHSYYQWVPFMLFFHGLCFYLPHWIWKTWEGGKIKLMSEDIRGIAMTDSKERREKRENVVNFLISTRNHHKKYAYAFFGCELLNLINIAFTMYIIEVFLGNVFMQYGLSILGVFQEEQDDRKDPMIIIFPRVTKCLFKTYGVMGRKQEFDALCVLPLNNLNEKIYIFVWFWLVFLACITFCAVAYSAAFLTLPDIRRLVIVKRFRYGTKYEVNELIRQTGVGDFLILHLLGQNLSSVTFHQLLHELNDKLLYPQKSTKNYPYEDHSDRKSTIQSSDTTSYPSYKKSMDDMDLVTINQREPLMMEHFPNEKSAAA